MDPKGDLSPDSLYSGDARKLVLEALYKEINPKGRKQKKAAKKILSSNAEIRVAQMVLENPSLLGKTIPITFALDDDIDSFLLVWAVHVLFLCASLVPSGPGMFSDR